MFHGSELRGRNGVDSYAFSGSACGLPAVPKANCSYLAEVVEVSDEVSKATWGAWHKVEANTRQPPWSPWKRQDVKWSSESDQGFSKWWEERKAPSMLLCGALTPLLSQLCSFSITRIACSLFKLVPPPATMC